MREKPMNPLVQSRGEEVQLHFHHPKGVSEQMEAGSSEERSKKMSSYRMDVPRGKSHLDIWN